jgi:hypothetical protein
MSWEIFQNDMDNYFIEKFSELDTMNLDLNYNDNDIKWDGELVLE